MLYFSLSKHHRHRLTLNVTFCTSSVQEFMSTMLHVTMAGPFTVNCVFPMAISFTLFSFTHEFCSWLEASGQCCVDVMTTFTNGWNCSPGPAFLCNVFKTSRSQEAPVHIPQKKVFPICCIILFRIFHFTGWWSNCCC